MLAPPPPSSAGSRPTKARWEWAQLPSDPSATPQRATRSPPSSDGRRRQVKWRQVNTTWHSFGLQRCRIVIFQMFSINYRVFHVRGNLILVYCCVNGKWDYSPGLPHRSKQWLWSVPENGAPFFGLFFFVRIPISFSCSSFEPKLPLEQFVVDMNMANFCFECIHI